jgi:hypothetical protein
VERSQEDVMLGKQNMGVQGKIDLKKIVTDPIEGSKLECQPTPSSSSNELRTSVLGWIIILGIGHVSQEKGDSPRKNRWKKNS